MAMVLEFSKTLGQKQQNLTNIIHISMCLTHSPGHKNTVAIENPPK